MSAPVLHHHTRGSVPVLTLQDRVEPDAVRELRRLVSTAVNDGHRLIIIDLLAVAPMEPAVLSELGDALRVLTGPARLAIVASNAKDEWIRTLGQIDGVELHPTIPAAGEPRLGAHR